MSLTEEKVNDVIIPLDIQFLTCNLPYHLKEQFLGQNSPQIFEPSSSYTAQNPSFEYRTDIPHHQLFPSSPVQYTAFLWFLHSTKAFDHLIITCPNLYLNYLHQYLKNVQ